MARWALYVPLTDGPVWVVVVWVPGAVDGATLAGVCAPAGGFCGVGEGQRTSGDDTVGVASPESQPKC